MKRLLLLLSISFIFSSGIAAADGEQGQCDQLETHGACTGCCGLVYNTDCLWVQGQGLVCGMRDPNGFNACVGRCDRAFPQQTCYWWMAECYTSDPSTQPVDPNN